MLILTKLSRGYVKNRGDGNMEAILLVGGKGTRLHPLTLELPKPMIKVAGIPFIAHQIAFAKEHGVSRIVVATSFKSEKFEEYLGNGADFGVEIVHMQEVEPLGTGGAIRNAARALESNSAEPIIILNGDIFSAHNITEQVSVHREHNADVTLHLIRVEDARAYGSVPTDESGRILEFVEKSENPPTQFINAGCYIFTRAIIDLIPPETVVSVERETFPSLLAENRKLWSYKSDTYWIDIGTPAALLKASHDLIAGNFHSPVFDTPASGRLIDNEADIADTAIVGSGCAIGSSRVEANVVIEKSIVGDGVHIEAGACISESIIGDGVIVASGTRVVGEILVSE